MRFLNAHTIGKESLLQQMLRVEIFIFYTVILRVRRKHESCRTDKILWAQPHKSIAELGHLAELNRKIK